MAEKSKNVSTAQETVHRDPVCGMEMTGSLAAAKATVGETTYYFCSVACKQRFRLGAAPSTKGMGPPGTVSLPAEDAHGISPRNQL